jgi:MFS transporter, ACS family, tartrate transporter
MKSSLRQTATSQHRSRPPANIVLARVGAKHLVFSIMTLWAVFSTSAAFIQGPTEFYIQRFLLGAAESGFFPGMMYYLSLWFPAAYRARFAAMIIVGTPAAFVFGGPLSTLLLDMDGIAGFHGWQWLFVIEGAPVLLLAAAALKLLPDGPNHAPFLTSHEKDFIAARLALEDGSKPTETGAAFRDARILSVCGISPSRCSSARPDLPSLSPSVPLSSACSAVCPLFTTFPECFCAAMPSRPATR